MNYLTNYYKNLSEQLQQKVNFLQKTLNEAYGQRPHDDASRDYAADLNREFTDIAAGEEEAAPTKKGIKLSLIDRVEGTAHNQTGIGAKYIAHGEDGKHYTFWSSASWAWDNEDPGLAPQTWEVHSGNPSHEIENLTPVDWNNKHDAREYYRYHPDFKG